MTLHPQSKKYLEQLASLALSPIWETGATIARERRRAGLEDVPKGPELARVEDRVLDVNKGIPTRIYWPSDESGLPLLIWFHGGGWVTGGLDEADAVCRRLAQQSQTIVISVDYRHAPEDIAPAAYEDSIAATSWAAEHAAELGADAARIAVGGDSAGGNLAAAVALDARDRGPVLVHQLLVYPVTDSRMDTVSYQTCADGFGLSRASMIWFWDQYVPDDGPVSRTDPRVSPAHASNLSGLPHAHVITAEYDPLCDEGEAYARSLEAAGVSTRLDRVDGHLHGFFGTPHIFDAGEVAIREAALELQASFGRAPARA